MKLLCLLALAFAFALPTEASAHLVRVPDSPSKTLLENRLHSQTENLAHALYVCRHGGGDHKAWGCWAASSVVRSNGQGWLRAERQKTVSAVSVSLSPRALAYKLTIARGWSTDDLDEIIGQESGWNPCRHYPSTTNCGYTGSNACGIPQANPCPSAWRGNLWGTRYQQVYWLMDYLQAHHGGLPNAVAHKRLTGWY